MLTVHIHIKQYPLIFMMLLMLTISSNAQTLALKEVYKLKSKRFSWLPDSTVYKDSVNLDPFKPLENAYQISLFVDGLEQNFRFDIRVTSTDTIAFVTSSIYEVKPISPTRNDKKMFPNLKIEKKEVWVLKTKTTTVDDTFINGLLRIIQSIDFDSLPNYEKIRNDVGLLQLDGHSFGFKVVKNNRTQVYSTPSLYLNKHGKLKNLKPIENLILNFLNNNPEVKVEYQNGTCYNSGSMVWVCKMKNR